MSSVDPFPTTTWPGRTPWCLATAVDEFVVVDVRVVLQAMEMPL